MLTDADIAKVKESLSVDAKTKPEEVVAKLNAEAENGNPTWANIVAGIDETNKACVATAANADTNTIDLGLANIKVNAGVGTNVEIAYEIDEVDANGTTLVIVPTTKLVGVQKTTRKAKKTIISVPWHSLADDANISVPELVMTSNLTEDDKLYVYNVDKKIYDVYTLKADKTWEAAAVYTIGADGQMSVPEFDKSDGTKIARDSGVWLAHQNTDTPIISYGQLSLALQHCQRYVDGYEALHGGLRQWQLYTWHEGRPGICGAEHLRHRQFVRRRTLGGRRDGEQEQPCRLELSLV